MSGPNNYKKNKKTTPNTDDAIDDRDYVWGLEGASSIIGVTREQVRNLITGGDLKDHGSGGFYKRRKFLLSDCQKLANPNNRTKAGRKHGWRKVK